MRTVFLFERGILGWGAIVGQWSDWPNQAVMATNKRFGHDRAQALLYFTLPFTAGITRPWRSKWFGQMLAGYRGWRIVIAAHSEGTATVLDSLRRDKWPYVDRLHLICGACDSDFQRNGLNFALQTQKIGKVITYRAGKDQAMKLENLRLGRSMFDIHSNPLGYKGPENVADGVRVGGHLEEVEWDTFGHSTCWEDVHFQETMKEIWSR